MTFLTTLHAQHGMASAAREANLSPASVTIKANCFEEYYRVLRGNRKAVFFSNHLP